MSNLTNSGQQNVIGQGVAAAHALGRPASRGIWWLVCKQELVDLWIRGRVLLFLIIFTVLMSGTAIAQERESQLDLIPPPEIIYILLQSTIAFGLIIGLIVGADSISGERERMTLEPLLLTPASRFQIVLGKFLAALSPWPVAFLLSIPYTVVLAAGNDALGKGLILAAIMGSFLSIAFTATAMVVSIWSNSNRISLIVTLFIYLLMLIPTLWPGVAQKGDLGYLIKQINPMQGTSQIFEKMVVNNRTLQEMQPYATSTILAAVGMTTLLFAYAAPRLRREGEPPGLLRSSRPMRLASVLILVGLAALAVVRPLHAAPLAQAQVQDGGLKITVDLDHKIVNAGERIKFNTTVVNQGSAPSAPFHVSMNIIKIGSGDPVDPEDWSPERSQEIAPLDPGATSKQSWTVDAILEGNYMVYMTVIPTPKGANDTSQPSASNGIHVSVKPFANTNPGGVVPVALAIPTILILATLILRRSRRPSKQLDVQPG